MARFSRSRSLATARSTRAPVASLLAVAAVLALGGSVSAADVNWNQQTLRNAPSTLQDADFAGTDVAVAWREGGDVYLRTSTNSGSTFRTRRLVAPVSREAETEICGEDVYTAYAHHFTGKGDTWELHVTRLPLTGAGRDSGIVAAEVQDPDVACAGGRVFASWLGFDGSDWNVMLDHARKSDLDFLAGPGGDPADDFGATWEFGGQPVLAGAGSRAYLAWEASIKFSDGPIRFKRYLVGGGPQYPVTSSASVQLAAIGSYPAIGAGGTKVVVAFTNRCGSLRVRVSNDRGATWAPSRELVHLDCNVADAPWYLASNVALRGNRVIVAYDAGCGGIKSPPCAEERVISTTNDFATFTDKQLKYENTFADFETGLLTVGSSGKLAMAEDRGTRILFLRQQ